MRIAWAASLVASLVVAPVPGKSRVISDAEIRQILVERIDVQRQGVGIVVGIIEPQGRRVIAYGKADDGDPRTLDGDTVFEIGSVTKVFTSLLLADMVQRSEVVLTDPVAKYLPKDVRVPEHGGKAITLEDLATHTSGLPREPTNLKPKDASNPFADYTVVQLYDFLSGYSLTRDPGVEFEYSNIGVALLGHALARRAGFDYDELVRSRIAMPLGMTSTAVTLTPEMQARLAPGHNGEFSRLANFVESPTLAGDGALRSSANDMLTFLAAQLGFAKTPLAAAMEYTLAARRKKGSSGDPLGWDVFTQNGKKIDWHNGATFGYNSFLGFMPKTRVGVVVLSNTRSLTGVDDIGFHLLDSRAPLAAPKIRHETGLDPKVLDRYVGRYQVTPELVLTITHQGNGLFVQATNDVKCRLYPESERDFFLKIVDAQISFALDSQSRATQLTLHQFGQDKVAQRIE